jgi:predicted solute-binding protein
MTAQKQELECSAGAAEKANLKIKDLEEKLQKSNYKVHRKTGIFLTHVLLYSRLFLSYYLILL